MTYNKEEIKAQVKRILDYSNNMDSKVDVLIDKWEQNKSRLLKEFGGRLIIESPSIVVVDKPEENKHLEYVMYVDDIVYSTINEELRAFLKDQGCDGFYENMVKETWEKFGIKVPKGMKISRALKFFIEDKEDLDRWQTKYSKILQDVKIQGRLCLSIHPLDFLSMSETTHNWRSCHSLDGEYRAGNLSYMLDKSTVVVYVKSEGVHVLPNFPEEIPWNAKKWRMLAFVNEERNLLFASKPYPFDNCVLVQRSFEMLEKVFPGKWPEHYAVVDPDDAIDYIQDVEGSIHFNDCLSSATYIPRYKCMNGNEASVILVGARVPCLKCGEDYLALGADYRCSNCGGYITCGYCDCVLYLDEACKIGGEHFCSDCYDSIAVRCPECGKVHDGENQQEVVYNPDDGEWYCRSCYNDRQDMEEEEEE